MLTFTVSRFGVFIVVIIGSNTSGDYACSVGKLPSQMDIIFNSLKNTCTAMHYSIIYIQTNLRTVVSQGK